jgi:hypothetical protein
LRRKPKAKKAKKRQNIWGYRAQKPIREPVIRGSKQTATKSAPKKQKSIMIQKATNKKQVTTPADVVKDLKTKEGRK